MTPLKINCEQAKKIDMVDYLETLNIKPVKVSRNDFWYAQNRDDPVLGVAVQKKLWGSSLF